MEPLWRVSGETEWRRFDNAGNEEDQIDGRLPLDYRDFTSLSYDKASRTFTLSTFIGAVYTLMGPESDIIAQNTTTAVDTQIKLPENASGLHMFRLNYGGKSHIITITL